MEISTKNPRRVAAGKQNGPLRSPRSPEERRRVRTLCLATKPWLASTGPRTAAGKARAAANGRRNKPDPESVRQLRFQLSDTYGFLGMMKSMRRQVEEQMRQRSADGNQKETEPHRQLQADRDSLKQLTALIRQIDANKPMGCETGVANRIADSVGTYVANVRAEATSKDTIPVEDMDAFELQEDRKFKQQWARLRRVYSKLTNRPLVSGILMGQLIAKPAVLKQLRDVLNHLASTVRERVTRGERSVTV